MIKLNKKWEETLFQCFWICLQEYYIPPRKVVFSHKTCMFSHKTIEHICVLTKHLYSLAKYCVPSQNTFFLLFNFLHFNGLHIWVYIIHGKKVMWTLLSN